jgi:succinate dehydrogenase / fumarate reductase iron-sulfur subunit
MSTATNFVVRILRQDRPQQQSYWQSFRLEREPGLNLTATLQRIAAKPLTTNGQNVAPVAYDSNCLEEVCGACTMLVNGRVRQACTALVDRLLKNDADTIELRPMSKFPVVRDLVVDRKRLFRALEKLKCWIAVDGYYDAGPGPKQSQEQQQAYVLSTCISCGCCLDACPQFAKVDTHHKESETSEEFHERERDEFDRNFIGAHSMSQVVLMNSHPTGAMTKTTRIEVMIPKEAFKTAARPEIAKPFAQKKSRS